MKVFSREDIFEMAEQGESNLLEFKEAKNRLPNSFWTTYSSFSNTGTGTVLLGIKENEDSNEIVGVNQCNKIIKSLITECNNTNKVSFSSLTDDHIQVVKIDDNTTIIAITIPEAPNTMKPVYINNNQSEAYVRFGDSDRKLDQIEINALVRNSSPRIDGHTLRFVSMQDLDETSIQEFKDIVSRRYPVFEYNLMSHEEFLFKIGAIKKNRLDETKGITNGLLLFLGKYNSIKEFFPTFHLDYFYIQGVDDRWSDRVSSDVPNLVEMNLFNFYNIVLSKILVQLPSPFNLNSNLERNERSELDEVIREALVNALAHADYESNQLTIKIQLFSDKIKLENPGSILIGIEPFILGGDSYPRNEIIMKLFRMMGVSERQGFGGYKIFDFAKKNSYKKPCIEQSICKTSITIYFDSNYYLNLLNDVDFLNVYNCIKDFKIPIARREIQAEIEIGEKRLREILNSFMDAGAITKIGAGPTTKYKVNK